MPYFELFNRRYNTLRLLVYDYNSTWQLCAISLVTDLRRPVFADVNMAKTILNCLLNNQTLQDLRPRVYSYARSSSFACRGSEHRKQTTQPDRVLQKLHDPTVLETQS